jgi:nitrite reductase (cytochrome c-552)
MLSGDGIMLLPVMVQASMLLLESARLLGSAIQKSEEARGAAILTSLNVKLPVPIPDLSTKEKAQQYIGFDLVEFSKEKERWKEEAIPKWDKRPGTSN